MYIYIYTYPRNPPIRATMNSNPFHKWNAAMTMARDWTPETYASMCL